jgi:hypothetical protein
MKTILTLLVLVLLTGCEERSAGKVSSLQQWESKDVTVFFRRDMLGAAGTPVSPIATWVNNAMVSLDGKIISARPDGIFLDSHYKLNSDDTEVRHSVFWIPNESILTVKSEK